jgi:hypothetical protein
MRPGDDQKAERTVPPDVGPARPTPFPAHPTTKETASRPPGEEQRRTHELG